MIIFCIFLSHSMKSSMFKSLKFPSFLFIFVCSWLESPISIFYTESRVKLDRYRPIIWYQILGGSFQFSVWSGLFRKSAGDVKRCLVLCFE
ncbi:hypothetical protein Hanom_Chr13g01188371 [Helianthus anomalus]